MGSICLSGGRLALAWVAAVSCILSSTSLQAQPRDGVLPLTRLRLYETGVAYFERSGRLSGVTRLPLPAAQLDDALSSLVVLGGAKDGGLVGVTFDTRVTEQLGRALARLPTDSDAVLDFEALARSLTGSEVELLAAGQRHRGRLLQVVPASDSGLERCLPGREASTSAAEGGSHDPAVGGGAGCVLRSEPALLFMRDSGELMRFGLSELQRLRPLAAGDLTRLRAALESAAGSHATEHTLQIRGAPSEQVTLGYVAEAPLWRTTYRLVLGSSGAKLQAWALLHNDSDEAWNHVRVELVNGQPDSFLFPLAAPRYARRRLVTPEGELSSVPQLLSGSADELWDHGEQGLGLGGIGSGGSGYGSGAGGFSHSAQVGDQESSLLAIGDLASHAEAEGQESGALYRYSLPSPIDLAAHASLLVPLLQDAVDAQRVSYFRSDAALPHSALLIRNTTQQTLPDGTLAVFEEGGFGGESALKRLKPGEQGVLPFGLDLDVEIERKGESERKTRKLVSFEHDQLEEHYERVSERRYELQNRSASARTLQIELAVVNNARIEHADAVLILEDEKPSAGYHLTPQSRRQVQLTTTEGMSHRTPLRELSAAMLAEIAADGQLPTAQRTQLTAAGNALAERARRQARKRQLAADIELLKAAASRSQQSLPIVAKADADRGRSLAAELVRTQTRLNERERERAALDLEEPLKTARAALAALSDARLGVVGRASQ